MRSLRGSLPSSIRKRSADLSGTPSLIGSTAPSDISPRLESSDEFEFITQYDLPIRLDDPIDPTQPLIVAPTRLSSLLPSRILRRVSAGPTQSLSAANPSTSLQPRGTRRSVGLHWPTLRLSKLRHRSKSILDDFPQPPSHIPTRIDSVRFDSFAASEREYPFSVPSTTLASTLSLHSPAVAAQSRNKDYSNHFNFLTKVPFPSRLRALKKGRRSQPETAPFFASLPDVTNTVNLDTTRFKPLPNLPFETAVPPVGDNSLVYNTSPVIYELVRACDLTSSPSPLLGHDLFSSLLPHTSARTSFVPPSPSWLSRNVLGQSVPDQESSSSSLDSPLPLPIPPPRILVSDPSEHLLLSPLEATEDWVQYTSDTRCRTKSSISEHSVTLSRSSSVTLTSRHSDAHIVADSLSNVSHSA